MNQSISENPVDIKGDLIFWTHVVELAKLFMLLCILIFMRFFWIRSLVQYRNHQLQPENALEVLRELDRRADEEDDQRQNRPTEHHLMLVVENFDPNNPVALGDGTPEYFVWREFHRAERRRQQEVERQRRLIQLENGQPQQQDRNDEDAN